MWIALAWHDDAPPVWWRPMTMLWSHLTRGAAECHKDKSPSPFIRLCFILCLLIRRRMKIRMTWVGWDDSVVDKDDEDQDEDDVLSNAGWHVCAPLVSEWPRLPAAERLVVARQSPASGVTLPHPPQSVSVPALARIRRSSGKSASELVTISDQHLWQLCLLCLTRRFVRQGSIQIAWFVGKIFHSEFSGFDKNHKVNGNLLLRYLI